LFYVLDFVFSMFVQIEILTMKGVEETDVVCIECQLKIYWGVVCIVELYYFEFMVVVEVNLFVECEK
jgi:hypothetical protein